jgi:hypothetical protein
MITDPRSTPDRRLGRILFAVSVAGLAYWLQFRWQLHPALFYALAVMSPLTPVIDRVLPTPPSSSTASDYRGVAVRDLTVDPEQK